ncbi:MAG: hypothetical protein HN837_08945, partial [Chloroflexi bacterium]|nr:hypothetical protein [Chloroflexota bacterium]
MTKTRNDFEPDDSPMTITPEQEAIRQLAKLIENVCGLNKDWGKTCIYYCMATHKLNEINWMPNLEIVGQKGSGKSRLMDILCALCYEPYRIIGHQRITSVTLRNELGKAENKTAIIEEGDLFPNRKELESYLINRVDKKRTAQVAVTVQNKSKQWETIKFGTFGATILHDRHEMVDMAADRRSIVINIKHQRGKHFLLL